MAEIINLRRARKARARDEADRQAAENRHAHGRTRAERDAAKAEAELTLRKLERHRRDAAEDGSV